MPADADHPHAHRLEFRGQAGDAHWRMLVVGWWVLGIRIEIEIEGFAIRIPVLPEWSSMSTRSSGLRPGSLPRAAISPSLSEGTVRTSCVGSAGSAVTFGRPAASYAQIGGSHSDRNRTRKP